MASDDRHTITCALALSLVEVGHDAVQLAAELRYRAIDPYAVEAEFLAPDAPVRWTFARDLLAEGLWRPAGRGDVQVRPAVDATGHAVVELELRSPDGEAVLHASAVALDDFLRRTYELVPPGEESSHVDLDAAVARLLWLS